MKISELRTQMGESTRENLEAALALVYKTLPKAKKEEIDEDLSGVLRGETPKKPVKKEKTVDVGEVFPEIGQFLTYVDDGLYVTPNRIVPKSQRSRWRFAVMRWVKALLAIPEGSPDYEQAAAYLGKLYEKLCFACRMVVLPTRDPFAAIEVCQEDFYRSVAEHYLYEGTDRENVRAMAELSVNPGLSYESLTVEQMGVLVELAEQAHLLDDLDAVCRELLAEHRKKEQGLPEFISYFDPTEDNHFDEKNKVQHLDELILAVACRKQQAPAAFSFYFANAGEKDKEVALYIAMHEVTENFGTTDDTIAVYDYAVQKREVKPRDELREWYEELKKGPEQD